MELIIAASFGTFIITVLATYLIVNNRAKKQIGEYKSIKAAIDNSKEQLADLKAELVTVTDEIAAANQALANTENDLAKSKESLARVNKRTKKLRKLEIEGFRLEETIKEKTKQLEDIVAAIASKKNEIASLDKQLHETISKIDLYSRLDDFTENGFFEMPAYLYETSARFAEEIRRIRGKQKDLIKNKAAITCPASVTITANNRRDKKILDGQIKLMLAAYNINCDLLIGKVTPANYTNMLKHIEKLAETLEKSAATLHCGFNIEYVKLKYRECTLQYQYKLKKEEEKEEKRLVREQMREEQKAIREYKRAMAQAEEEERLYKDLLAKVQEQLKIATEKERAIAVERIAELENLLAVAQAKGQRAKSMAEQTRRGYVYILSNIGSFGENIYKIGLTRRIDPELRVKELGDASVPFKFDVHAMFYAEDAPAIEAALHREFKRHRVNAVNFRKEFFRVDLESIKSAVEKIAGGKADFKMTALAEEYYDSRRLQSSPALLTQQVSQ